MALPSPNPLGTSASNILSPYRGLGADASSIVLEGLSPNTNYSITLCAFTATGCGASTTYINQTNEDGERFSNTHYTLQCCV